MAAAGEQRLYREEGFRENSHFYHRGDGYYYHFSYDTFSTIYFTCASSTCYGRAKWQLGGALEQTQHHNHSPDLLRSEILALRRNILTQARSMTYMSFSEIIRQERSRILNREIRSRITYRGLRSAMQRVRNDIFPRIPANLRELTEIHRDAAWVHLTRTTDMQDFIYSGSVDSVDGSHSVIYCIERNIQLLREVPTIFADGTFYITPSINNCYQVFTIVSVNGHTVIPLVWCLMERKTEAAYISVLVHLRIRLGRWNFTLVICDYEDAIISAFRRVFEVDVQGCFFHFVSALVKWARCNLSYFYLNIFNEPIDVIRLCCALPLLPRNLLLRGFIVIVQRVMGLGHLWFLLLLPFLLYVQTSWINHANRGHSLSVCGSIHRTNNASESNNRRMNLQVQRAHPNIFHFLHVLVQIEDATVDDMNSLNIGHVPNRNRSCHSISNDENIITLTNQLLQSHEPTDEQIYHFLHSAASTVDTLVEEALELDPDEPELE